MKGCLVISAVLALLAGLFYFLAGSGVLQPGDLGPEEAPGGIAYVAGLCYVAGGLLILLKKRWLWIVGAVINALVIIVFVAAYAQRPAVLFSAAGIGTKTAQILLEAALVCLIVTGSRTRKQTPA